jgi:CDP-paratose 2-epimerase
VLRQSCIYGPYQLGTEDQGWVAWLMLACHAKKSVSIYGSGKQVRDLLFIDDLVDLFEILIHQGTDVAGHVFNVGGGPGATISVLELLTYLSHYCPEDVSRRFCAPRPGDQLVYVSNIERVHARLGWQPKIKLAEGLDRAWQWIQRSSSRERAS